MKVCVLVKEVPDPGVRRRLDPATGRLDRTGARGLNPFDAHALEAAVRLRETAATGVEEIVALTMGPESAARVLRRAISMGADRAVHLTDPALVGSCVVATGYALARMLERERPDLVLLGQQSDDGECYAMPAIVGEQLGMPALSQVVGLELVGETLRCERQAEYGYDAVELDLPAVVSVGDAINEPRYPSLDALVGGRVAAIETLSAAAAGIAPSRIGAAGSRTRVLAISAPPSRPRGEIVDGSDPAAAVERIVAWLAERRLV